METNFGLAIQKTFRRGCSSATIAQADRRPDAATPPRVPEDGSVVPRPMPHPKMLELARDAAAHPTLVAMFPDDQDRALVFTAVPGLCRPFLGFLLRAPPTPRRRFHETHTCRLYARRLG